jgi:hypothetical protein
LLKYNIFNIAIYNIHFDIPESLFKVQFVGAGCTGLKAVCGAGASNAIPFNIPDNSVSEACLATGPIPSLVKRVQGYSITLNLRLFTCSTTDDGNKNPYQSCLNIQKVVCNKTVISGSSALILQCKQAVNSMYANYNSLWKDVLQACAPWKGGSSTSNACNSANTNLIQGASYTTDSNLVIKPITEALTNDVKAQLWSNTELSSPL